MIYDYKCQCGKQFDVIKSMHDASRKESCPKCNHTAKRIYTAPQLVVRNDEPEYNPALGCVVRNSKHRKEIVKQNNLIEVGNEKVDIIHKDAETNYNDRMNKDYDA